MNVMSVANWVAVSEYQPVAHINKPISDFAHQFHTATVFMKDGKPGLLFSNKDRQFILRELADNDQTEILVPVKTAAAQGSSRAGN